jgi:hypothetical protein
MAAPERRLPAGIDRAAISGRCRQDGGAQAEVALLSERYWAYPLPGTLSGTSSGKLPGTFLAT